MLEFARKRLVHAMKRKRQKRPDEGLGKFLIIGGCAMVILPLSISGLDFGQRCSAAASGFMGLSWGLKEVAAAKKWKQEYGEPDLAERMEIKKRHSVLNLPISLILLVSAIAALVFLGLLYLTRFIR
jgi:hypothetical protein